MATLPMVAAHATLPRLPNSPDDLLKRWAANIHQAIDDSHSVLAARTEDMIRSGLESAIPAAKGTRRFYVATDSHKLFFDSGTWDELLSTSASGGNFAWYEVPSGTLGTGHLTFTLAHTPTAEPLILMGRRAVVIPDDYSRAGVTLTFVSGHEPQDAGDPLYAFYPY